jgi:prepilin-type N-terminal cleavage/methylation domain-containing protein
MLRERLSAFTLPMPRGRVSAFTLIEMLVVVLIVGIMLAFLIPALSPSSARALDGDSRNFLAQLENARMMALSKRTKTRVLIAATNDWGTDFSWRSYVLTSFDSTTGNWLQQGKFFRLSQSTTFDSATGIVATRSASSTQVVNLVRLAVQASIRVRRLRSFAFKMALCHRQDRRLHR